MSEYVRKSWAFLTEGSVALDPSSFSILPILAGIVGFILIVLIVIVVLQMNKNAPRHVLKGPVNLYKPASPIVVDRASTKANMAGSYTLSFYLRIDAVPDMRSAATPLFTWPGIWNLGYNAAQEELVWSFGQTSDNRAPVRVTLPQVPLQRWTQIAMTFEGRTLDLYVNGVLVKSDILDSMPPRANSSITVVPEGIMGAAAYIQLWARRLTVSEIGANFTDTSDSQGRPYLGPALNTISVPNLFCSDGDCSATPTATPSQKWEFPYA